MQKGEFCCFFVKLGIFGVEGRTCGRSDSINDAPHPSLSPRTGERLCGRQKILSHSCSPDLFDFAKNSSYSAGLASTALPTPPSAFGPENCLERLWGQKDSAFYAECLISNILTVWFSLTPLP